MSVHYSETPFTPDAVWRLLAQVSHDLRGPLTVILGNAQLLQSSHPDGTDGVASILGAARKMQTMLDRLTALAQRVQGGNGFEPGSATEVAYTTGVVALLGEVLGQAVQVVSVEGGAAADAWPVVLRLDHAALLASAQSRAEEARQAWGQTVSPALTWTGAALRLQWPMPDGQPSALTLEVPATVATEAALGEQDLAMPDPVPRGRLGDANHTIWLAEDHAEVRELLVRVLSDWGFRVLAWPDGRPLIEHLEARIDDPPDLVLTDLTMPGATGDDVLQACRAVCPAVPVVLLSGTQPLTLGVLASTAASGFDAAMTKPIHWRRLRHILQELLRLPLGDTPEGHSTSSEMVALRDALAMGAVTDIVDLAKRQAQVQGPHHEFWRTVAAWAENGDLDAIEDRLQWLTQPTG